MFPFLTLPFIPIKGWIASPLNTVHGLLRWLSGKGSACQCKRHRKFGFDPWVVNIPWRRKWQPTPVFLPGKSQGQRRLMGYCSWDRKMSDTTDWLRTHLPTLSMKRQKDRTLKDELPRSVGVQYAPGDQWRTNSRKNEEMEPKQTQHPVVVVTDAGVLSRLIEFCQENTLVIANTLFQQHKRRLYTWTSPDGQYQKQIDYILCNQRWKSSIPSARTRQGADCGSDHELLIAKSWLKLKKVGKTTRPFRYDLNQIPYDYTVEVRNRFKGVYLIDRVPEELWTEDHDIVQETGIKTIPKKKKCKKANGCLSRPYKQLWKEKWKAKEKRKDIPIWMQSSKEQ